jgi:LPXTG-motif cell wall-anchored protein
VVTGLVAGIVLGGGIAALGGVVFGRRRRKQQQQPESLRDAVMVQVGEFVRALTR